MQPAHLPLPFCQPISSLTSLMLLQDDSAPHGLANVASEVARARTLHCAGCGRAGAALGCAVKR